VRAARVHRFGEPLVVEEAPEPSPGPGEVLVEVAYAGVNPLDLWVSRGTVAGGSQPLPFIPGAEGVGRAEGRWVVVRGAGVGVTRDGTYAERVAVPPEAVFDLPEGADPVQAAALPIVGATAWALAHRVAGVAAEDRALVLGASGGVGSLLLQVLRSAGVRAWGQTGSPEKAAFVQDQGAERVVVTEAQGLAEAVAELRPTVVFDPLGDGYTDAAIQALEPYGRLVLFGVSAGPSHELDLRQLYRKAISLLTYSGTIEPVERLREATEAVLAELAAGRLRVPVDDVLPLEAAPEAHRRIEERRVRGKLVLEVRAPRGGA
jgi:NADPH2:quinone reductase